MMYDLGLCSREASLLYNTKECKATAEQRAVWATEAYVYSHGARVVSHKINHQLTDFALS